MRQFCDLHTHSYYSDGSLSPAALLAEAEKQGLGALALTDHNTAKGLHEFTEAGKKSSVIAVPGCEFSTDFNKTELHIIGMFLPEESSFAVDRFCETIHAAKRASNRILIENLQAAGFDISFAEIASGTEADEFNRAHVARYLVRMGYMKTVAEAFRTVLKEGAGFYYPPRRPYSPDVVTFIKSVGGIAVLAHPLLSTDEETLLHILPVLKSCGLNAMETRYTTYDENAMQTADRLAERFGLLASGGSDFHGEAKPDISVGTGRGGLQVPFSFYECLRDAANGCAGQNS